MPFQPINFSNVAPIGNPAMRDFVENLIGGYKASQEPARMERQRKQEEIANALAQFNLEKAPEKFKSDMARTSLLNSLTQMQIQNAREDRDPNIKIARAQQYLNGLKNAGVQITPDMEKGYYRKALGLEEQSPEAKLQQALSLEMAKNQIRNKSDLTTATKTANQTIIRGVDATLPVLLKLQKMQAARDVPGQLINKYFKRDRQVKYQSMVNLLTDSLVSAYGLPKTNESLHLVSNMVARQPGESDENYDNRLVNLVEELKSRKKQASTDLGREGTSTFNLETGEFE